MITAVGNPVYDLITSPHVSTPPAAGVFATCHKS